jgi:hypothetical protein
MSDRKYSTIWTPELIVTAKRRYVRKKGMFSPGLFSLLAALVIPGRCTSSSRYSHFRVDAPTIENVLLKAQVIVDDFVVAAKWMNGGVVVAGRKVNKFAVSRLLLN